MYSHKPPVVNADTIERWVRVEGTYVKGLDVAINRGDDKGFFSPGKFSRKRENLVTGNWMSCRIAVRGKAQQFQTGFGHHSRLPN